MFSSEGSRPFKVRLLITGLFVTGIGIVLVPIILGLLAISFLAILTVSSTYARNVKRQTQVNTIIVSANEFYKRHLRYPNSLEELKTEDYQIQTVYEERQNTYPYSYSVTENGKNCAVSGFDSNGKLFTKTCKE